MSARPLRDNVETVEKYLKWALSSIEEIKAYGDKPVNTLVIDSLKRQIDSARIVADRL